MSARASWHIYCDICGNEMGSTDQGCSTATWARREAARMDGHRSKGKDICEYCWGEGKR